MKPVSNEVRGIIIKHYEAGMPVKDIVPIVFRSEKTVYRMIDFYKKTGKIESKKWGGNNHKITPEMAEKILEYFANIPDSTLCDAIEKLGLDVTESGLSRFLKLNGIVRKKNTSSQQTKA
jgi:transposase